MRSAKWMGLMWLALACCGGCDTTPETRETSAGTLRLGALLGGEETMGFRRADQVRPFQFPADHAAHEGFKSEWWYLVSVLTDEFGDEFGVQFTVFRQAINAVGDDDGSNPWRSGQAFLGHFAVSDVTRRQHREHERLARGHPRLAGVQAQPFRLWLDGWSVTAVRPGDTGIETLELAASADQTVARLALKALKPIVLQGDRGLSAKGPGQASYYYSLPRFSVTGELTLDGIRHAVTGSAWLDREWSTSVLGSDQEGWDWFALQLDDAVDIMVFQLRRKDGVRDRFDHGIQVGAEGSSQVLGMEDFSLTPIAYWVDERGVRWPVGWRLNLQERQLWIRAPFPDQRMDTTITYWEGLVDVFDESGGRLGRGYMELTGYDQQ